MSVNATKIDKENNTATCPCGEEIYLPREGPYLVGNDEVWYPVLVAVRCHGCKQEVRLDS